MSEKRPKRPRDPAQGMVLDVFIAAAAGAATYAFGVDGMQSGNAAFAGLVVFIVVLILLDRWRRGWF